MHYSLSATETNGVLYPSATGDVPIEININVDEAGNKTATISFYGVVQGFAVYDSTGTRIIAITMTAMGVDDTLDIGQSLNNIVAVM